VLASGGRGSLVNHSEHPLSFAKVRQATRALAGAGLAAVVCARDRAAARRLASVRPPYLAIEPPELIGGKRSVSTARPAVVVEGVAATHAVSPATWVLCGAGIHDRHDVSRALELGADGVLVASAVARATSPRSAIDELLSGY
jgi:triosephosphate isomerase (TIM)